MADFREKDLGGSRFERVSLRGASFQEVYLTDVSMHDVDLSGLQVRGAQLTRSQWRGVELADVEISGRVHNVRINGVDIAPLVEAELDRRMPERAAMRPADADGFRAAWLILGRLWDETIDRAQARPEIELHHRVRDEWSFIETLRHLSFASACWVDRMILGIADPWHPLDLPWDEAPGWAGVPWNREARPSLREVLELRAQRKATLERVMAELTDEALGREVEVTDGGPPEVGSTSVEHCLRVVLTEHWEHRLFAERDLMAMDETTGRVV